MKLDLAIETIRTFWKDESSISFGNKIGKETLAKVESEFPSALPEDLRNYILNYAPENTISFATVGNPYDIYAVSALGYKQDGYTYNTVTKSDIEGWNKNHFIFSDEGGDPVIIDLSAPDDGVQKLIHGAGSWDFGAPIADSIGQFLLCAAAQQHALFNFEEESIIDDEKGFNLAPEAAKWYFPKMKKWAGSYYEDWCSVFNNY